MQGETHVQHQTPHSSCALCCLCFKATPVSILPLETRGGCKAQKLPGDVVPRAVISTRTNSWPGVPVQKQHVALQVQQKGFFSSRSWSSDEGFAEKLRNHQSKLLVSLPASGHNYSWVNNSQQIICLTNFCFISWKIHESFTSSLYLFVVRIYLFALAWLLLAV